MCAAAANPPVANPPVFEAMRLAFANRNSEFTRPHLSENTIVIYRYSTEGNIQPDKSVDGNGADLALNKIQSILTDGKLYPGMRFYKSDPTQEKEGFAYRADLLGTSSEKNESVETGSIFATPWTVYTLATNFFLEGKEGQIKKVTIQEDFSKLRELKFKPSQGLSADAAMLQVKIEQAFRNKKYQDLAGHFQPGIQVQYQCVRDGTYEQSSNFGVQFANEYLKKLFANTRLYNTEVYGSHSGNSFSFTLYVTGEDRKYLPEGALPCDATSCISWNLSTKVVFVGENKLITGVSIEENMFNPKDLKQLDQRPHP